MTGASHSSHLECWWSLAPPFHPYPGACPAEAGWFAVAVCFLWHCPAGRPGWSLATTLPCEARTFLGDVSCPETRGHSIDATV